jgi:hypothetical protein
MSKFDNRICHMIHDASRVLTELVPADKQAEAVKQQNIISQGVAALQEVLSCLRQTEAHTWQTGKEIEHRLAEIIRLKEGS